MDGFFSIPQAYLALAEWLAGLVFLYGMKPRRELRYSIPIALLWLLVQVSFFELTESAPPALWIPVVLAALMMLFGLQLVLCDMSISRGIYQTIMAFVLSELAAATADLFWRIHCLLWRIREPVAWQRAVVVLTAYAGVLLTMLFLVRYNRKNRTLLAVTGRDLAICALLGTTVFAVSNLGLFRMAMGRPNDMGAELSIFRMVVDLGGMAVLYAYHVQRIEAQAREELGAMQYILDNQYAQYRISRESIEMINRKYHDLKHQIAALRAEPDAATRNQWLDEMEADIKAYEAQNKTGNTVLDTLLTSKSLYCQKHQIDLTVVADGKQLSFLSVMDICTIFGNALDNAIECEMKLENKSRRMIHLTVTGQKQFLLLQVENYCPEDLEYQGGLPVTTKKDRANHGFGLKSIQQTAKKYGGTTTVGTEDGWFVLKVLIPLPEREEPQK